MQLKVIHSFPEWLPQTQTWMYHQARYLPANRVECHVACDRTANLEQFAVPNLHILGGYRSLRFWWDKVPKKLGLRRHSPFLVGLGRRLGAAVVHSHFGL